MTVRQDTVMLRRFRGDLHVHTCLSPCGDLEMSPRKIAERSGKLGIAIIAICDHNSAANVAAVTEAARRAGVVVLPGMEVCTREEVHLLAIFGSPGPAREYQAWVYDHLPGKNDPDVFGMQVLASGDDEVVGFEERLLIGAVDLSLEEIVDETHRLGGLAIASHIDKETNSVMSQLGFIPDSLKFDALELSCHIQDREARERFASCGPFTFVRNSDSHFLDDLGKNTCEYLLERPTFDEIRKALKREGGRMVCEV